MKSYRAFFFCVVLCFPALCHAQSVTGSSSIDVDPSTNTVTATCETDNDDGDYEADVGCTVIDDSNTVVASGGFIDHGEQGYAQVVVSFAGQPGTNYTVVASHSAICNITELPEGRGPTYYEDPYNYDSFQTEGENDGFTPYPGFYEWYGPGPDTQTRQKNIHVGNTTAGNAIAPTVTIKFTGNKSSGDNLTFHAANVCSENLGYVQCLDTNTFRYSFEGSSTVNKAANWTVKQFLVASRLKGVANDGTPFDISTTPGPDGPAAGNYQTVNGSPVFWLDSPGFSSYTSSNVPIFSATRATNFSVEVCSTINTSVCGSNTYFIKIVVSSGQLTSDSIGGYGSVSLNF